MTSQLSPSVNSPQGRFLSYIRSLSGVLAVLGVLGAIAATVLNRPESPEPSPVVELVELPALPDPEPEPAPPTPEPPKPPPPIEPDLEAIARAEADRDVARRDRERAEKQVVEETDRLKAAQQSVASAVQSARTLNQRLRDPSVRINQAKSRVASLRADRDRVQGELAALVEIPRPRARPLVERTPVARPAQGDEFHFEIRRDRVAYIDLEGLLDRVRTDAKVQLRLSNRLVPIQGKVGPVGDFAIEYEMSPDGLDLGGSLSLASVRASYSLNGWEIIPRSDFRGESLAEALQPGSDFGRAVNRLSPESATLTFWIYPDGFALYRQLREILHDQGFLIAARPLPSGVPIRGSPSGSLSAGQ